MSAQPEHVPPPSSAPPMRTLAQLRSALATWGWPGDLAAFEAELGAVELDDLTAVQGVTQAYRRRVEMRYDEGAMAALARTPSDVDAELRRKLAEAGHQ
ncbi:hypothetical protein AB0G74_30545 [Streptomyces sp. NPDC020875]|uniref:hypothetical protein n=1 Tax=Streptomyces sp. NPDC020875 TaxID=3154898 RepID=UPI0033FC310B